MRPHGIPQVNDGNVVSVILGGDGAVVTHDIALGIGRQEGHPRSTGVFDIGIEPVCGFTDTCRTDHHTVHISCIDKSNRIFTNGFTSYDDALLFRSAFFIRSPFVRLIRNVLVGFLDLFLGSPSCRAVLTLSDGFVSDTVQSVEV